MGVRHYKIEFTTEGPVHIGNGERYGKKDYFRSGDKVSVLDARSFISKMTPEQLEDYCNFLENPQTLQEYLQGDNALKALAEKAVLYRVDTDLAKARRGRPQCHDVWRFIKDGEGRPYVPGSSVKGMIRTALLVNMLLDDPVYRDYFNAAEACSREGRRRACDNIERKAFRREPFDGLDPIDIMKYVSVSDSDSLSVNDLVFAKKYDFFSRKDEGLHKRSMGSISDRAYYEGNGLNIYRESLRPGIRFNVSIDIDDRIDEYLAPLALDADGLQNAFKRSFELYRKCFLDHYDTGEDGTANDRGGKCRYIYEAGPLAGAPCRNNAVDGTGYCNTHQDKAGNANAASAVVCYLGGGVDFNTKTVMNALFENDSRRLHEISRILYSQFPTRIDFDLYSGLIEEVRENDFEPQPMNARYSRGKLIKGKDDHRHWQDEGLGVSPHTMKMGIVGKDRYPMGKCSLVVKER